MEMLEKVERVREKCNVSYEEARKALETCDGDVLDAIIMLENARKATERIPTADVPPAPEAAYELPEAYAATNSAAGTEASKASRATNVWKRFCTRCKELWNAGMEMSFIAERKGKLCRNLGHLHTEIGVKNVREKAYGPSAVCDRMTPFKRNGVLIIANLKQIAVRVLSEFFRAMLCVGMKNRNLRIVVVLKIILLVIHHLASEERMILQRGFHGAQQARGIHGIIQRRLEKRCIFHHRAVRGHGISVHVAKFIAHYDLSFFLLF